MVNERYTDFLKFALHRIIEIALYYEIEAKVCKDPANKLFLYFLAGKKRVQHVVLEMVAMTNKRGTPLELTEYNSLNSADANAGDVLLSVASSEDILRFAHKRAEKDLNLYISLAALEEDTQTKKLLSTLAKLSKDFIQDVTAGYAKFAFKRAEHQQTTRTNFVVPQQVCEQI